MPRRVERLEARGEDGRPQEGGCRRPGWSVRRKEEELARPGLDGPAGRGEGPSLVGRSVNCIESCVTNSYLSGSDSLRRLLALIRLIVLLKKDTTKQHKTTVR